MTRTFYMIWSDLVRYYLCKRVTDPRFPQTPSKTFNALRFIPILQAKSG